MTQESSLSVGDRISRVFKRTSVVPMLVPAPAGGASGEHGEHDVSDVDLSEFIKENRHPGNRCQWAKLVEDLPDERRKKLEAAMAEPSVQHAAIVRVLQSWGVAANKDSISRHRKNDCISCARARKADQ